MADDKGGKLDRELIELLNELRVALPGVQVLFAFLLTVPFSQGYSRLTAYQRDVFFVAFIATAIATAFLMAPSAHHRLRWRQHDKDAMLRTANREAIAGFVFLLIAIAAVVFLVTDVVFAMGPAVAAAAGVAGVCAALWFVLPGIRAAREETSGRSRKKAA